MCTVKNWCPETWRKGQKKYDWKSNGIFVRSGWLMVGETGEFGSTFGQWNNVNGAWEDGMNTNGNKSTIT